MPELKFKVLFSIGDSIEKKETTVSILINDTSLALLTREIKRAIAKQIVHTNPDDISIFEIISH
jgi:hypothetical protein